MLTCALSSPLAVPTAPVVAAAVPRVAVVFAAVAVAAVATDLAAAAAAALLALLSTRRTSPALAHKPVGLQHMDTIWMDWRDTTKMGISRENGTCNLI
jgi:ribosomal protein S12 methylthiotransferase accessory factor YcaO